MKIRIAALLMFAFSLALPALAGEIYNDGPINGTVDGWTINFGFVVGDSFTVSAGTSTINGIQFGAWLEPGDTLQSAEVQIESEAGGGTIYFDQTVNFTASGCAGNQYGYNVCTETGMFNGPTLNNGTYWLLLQNAVTAEGNPVYWDENSGAGCTSPGCPSEGYEPGGTIPAESFTVLGGPASGSTPEPGSILLFASGAVGAAGVLRRKFRG
jgi:hypothetical protein